MASLADRWCFIDQSMVKNKPRHTDVGHTVSPGSSEEVLMKKNNSYTSRSRSGVLLHRPGCPSKQFISQRPVQLLGETDW